MVPKIKKLNPENFEQECATVWSFPRRGNWATHKSTYRGNWAPDVVRNLILRYSNYTLRLFEFNFIYHNLI